MNDIFVRVVVLPNRIRAMTSVDADGNYNIYLNSILSREEMLKAYAHELKHIQNDDFRNGCEINQIELIRHKEEV